jgi:hypothetical protein
LPFIGFLVGVSLLIKLILRQKTFREFELDYWDPNRIVFHSISHMLPFKHSCQFPMRYISLSEMHMVYEGEVVLSLEYQVFQV